MNEEKKFLELKDTYDELAYRYSNLTDTDIEEAFSLMINSSSLQASLEELSVNLLKDVTLLEVKVKYISSKISLEEKSVAAGDRKAQCSDDVMRAQEELAEALKFKQGVDVIIKHLSRIYFDSKLVYENACRQTRDPVGKDKLVGRY